MYHSDIIFFKKLQRLKNFELDGIQLTKSDVGWYRIEFFIKSEELTEYMKNGEE